MTWLANGGGSIEFVLTATFLAFIAAALSEAQHHDVLRSLDYVEEQ